MTELIYLKNTYVFEDSAKVIEIVNNEFGTAVVLDRTIFYPQGGGQPADFGKMVSTTAEFAVNNVRLDEHGTVLHYGSFVNGNFTVGEEVKLLVDKDRRILNARLHSAGHLLDCAVIETGLINLLPTKGYHFADGPYVEYDGMIENSEEILPRLQTAVDDLINKNTEVQISDLSPEEARQQGIMAPPGKTARIVNFKAFPPCGCGGTHVSGAGEIGQITIRKISSKKRHTKIAYMIS